MNCLLLGYCCVKKSNAAAAAAAIVAIASVVTASVAAAAAAHKECLVKAECDANEEKESNRAIIDVSAID